MANKIEITFLGTGSAVPTIRRNHPAVLLKYKDENILFDCGEGTQRQFRKAKLNPCKLTKLFITHWHGDHVLGIPGLLQTLHFNNYNKTLEVYGPKGTKHYFDLIMDIFINAGRIKVNVHEISNGKIIDNEDFMIFAQEMNHGQNVRCLAYSFVEKDKIRLDKKKIMKLKLPNSPLMNDLKNGKDINVNGKKIRAKDVTYHEKGKKFVIALDTRANLDLVDLSKNANLFVCEATYLDDEEMAKQYGHMTMLQAIDVAKKSKTEKLILIHLSQKYEKDEKTFLNQAKKLFKNVVIAEDLMKISV